MNESDNGGERIQQGGHPDPDEEIEDEEAMVPVGEELREGGNQD